ncbi:MAG: DUF805 domain-containing protein [Bacteroidales bacterium]|jgi:uncharacterized membrane protein YhaH (DUF805 family)|nr:DUF805 domain-containing protein [Bacteroidales bacterium]
MFKNPFSFEGRIRRTEYGISFIIFAVARTIMRLVSVEMVSNLSYDSDISGVFIFNLILSIPLLWFLWGQGAKRCHDIGNSGWWQLIPFYSLWMIFQDGQPGPNQYGENPKDIQVSGGQTYQGGQNTGTSDGYQGDYSGGHNNPTNYSSTQNPSNTDGYHNGDLYK